MRDDSNDIAIFIDYVPHINIKWIHFLGVFSYASTPTQEET